MIPERASRITIGKSRRESPTARSKSPPGVPNSSTISGAARMKTAVSPVVKRRTSQKIVDATRHARARSPFSSSSLNTGTNAPESAVSATSARTRFGIWNATVNALTRPAAPNAYAATISRTSPSTRDSAVAAPKIGGGTGKPAPVGALLRECGIGLDVLAHPGEFRESGGTPLCYHPRARMPRALSRMANIKQQKKRVQIASRQRLENLRYRSTIKTLFKRLETARRRRRRGHGQRRAS